MAAVFGGLSAGVWFDFFLTKPYESFSIQRATNVQTTVLLIVVAILVGEVATRRRQARRDGFLARDEVLVIYRITEMLSAGRRSDEIFGAIANDLRNLLLRSECRYDPELNESRTPTLDRSGELQYGHLNWPLDTEGFPNRDVMLPVEFRGRRYGSYILRGPPLGIPLTQDQRLAAIALSDLAGAAANLETTTKPVAHNASRSPP